MQTTTLTGIAYEELYCAHHDKRTIPLLLLRNLHKLPECKFHANDGNDHLILDYDGWFRYILVSNQIITVGEHRIENGMGDVLTCASYSTYQDALRACMNVLTTDNDL